jgi:hypothetical protein
MKSLLISFLLAGAAHAEITPAVFDLTEIR